MHQTAELKTEITRMLAVLAAHHRRNVGSWDCGYDTMCNL